MSALYRKIEETRNIDRLLHDISTTNCRVA